MVAAPTSAGASAATTTMTTTMTATEATATTTTTMTTTTPTTTSTVAATTAATVKLRILKAAISNGPRDFQQRVATLTKWAQEGRPLRGHTFSSLEVEQAALEVQTELIEKAIRQGAEAAARASARAKACAAAAAAAKRKKEEEEAAAEAAGRAAAEAAAAEAAAAEAAAKAAETAELAPNSSATQTSSSGSGSLSGSSSAGTAVVAASAGSLTKADYLVRLPAPLPNDWPLPATSEAAFQVAGVLGDFPLHIRTKMDPADLLRALWRLLREEKMEAAALVPPTSSSSQGKGQDKGDGGDDAEEDDDEKGILVVLPCRDGKAFAHREILAAASGGEWKESCSQAFEKRVVDSALAFIYLGRVVLEPWLLPQLWDLSKFFGVLRDNLLTGMSSLSLGSQLQFLSGMDVCSPEELPFLPAFAAQLRDRLQAAKAMVQGPPDSTAATTVWKFVDFIGNWASLPATKNSSQPKRLKAWLDVPEISQDLLDSFLVKALENAKRSQLPMLSHWKPILSTTHIEKVVSDLAVSATDGLADETGNHKAWCSWVTSNCWDFGQLWGYYSTLQDTERGRQLNPEDLPEAVPTRNAAGALPDDVEWLFEKAFAESVLHDELGANTKQWEEQTFRNNGFSPWRSCLGLLQSWHRVARACLSSGSLPSGLSATALAIILPIMTFKMQATIVRVACSTCSSVNGIYKRVQRGQSDSASFLRISPHTKPQLILRRIPLDKAILVAWDGLPIRRIEEARCFWSIMRITDDQETDEPLAVGVHHTLDPTEVHLWWTPRSGRFESDRAFDILPEDIPEENSKPIVEAISKWSSTQNGLIAQLKQEVSRPVGQGRVADLRPAICQDFLARTLVNATIKKMCSKYSDAASGDPEASQTQTETTETKRPLPDGETGSGGDAKRPKLENGVTPS